MVWWTATPGERRAKVAGENHHVRVNMRDPTQVEFEGFELYILLTVIRPEVDTLEKIIREKNLHGINGTVARLATLKGIEEKVKEAWKYYDRPEYEI